MDKTTRNWIIASAALTSILVALGYIYRQPLKNVAKETFGGYKWFDEGLKWYRDSKTKNIVERLHPKASPRFKEFISRVEKELGIQLIATSGYRTWEEQAALKRKNPKNASAGNSSHNYGFALDVNGLKNGKNILRKADTTKKWKDSGIVLIAKDMGFKWGGDFTSYHDPIHFYLEPMSRDKMKATYLAGKRDADGYIDIA